MRISFHGAAQDVTGSCHLLECRRQARADRLRPASRQPRAQHRKCRALRLRGRGDRLRAANPCPSRPLRPAAAAQQARLQGPGRDHRRLARARQSRDPRFGLSAGERCRTRCPHRIAASAPSRRRRSIRCSTQCNSPRSFRQGRRPTSSLSRSPPASAPPSSTPATSSARPASLLELGGSRQAPQRLLLRRYRQCRPAAAHAGRVRRRAPMPSSWNRPMATACTTPYRNSVEELYAAITRVFARGGNVVIPTFALERAQELLYILRQGVEPIAFRRRSPVYPRFTDGDLRHRDLQALPRLLFAGGRGVVPQGKDPFALPGLHLRGARRLDRDQPGQRRRHHHGRLGHGDRRPRRPSPAAQSGAAGFRRGLRRLRRAGTLARRIIDGANHVAIFGETVQVRARSTRSTASPPTPIRPS